MKIITSKSRKNYHSPLRYPGGKTSLLPFFEKIIEDHDLQKITYIEPFAGGAGAALALLLSGKVGRIVINDLDGAIYAFWKSSVFSFAEFIKKIKKTPVTISEWKKQGFNTQEFEELYKPVKITSSQIANWKKQGYKE